MNLTWKLSFRSLSHREGAGLVKPFGLEEIKVAVWDCDSYKCPRPDNINFGTKHPFNPFQNRSRIG